MTAATTIVRQPALASSPQPTPTARALIAQCTKGTRPRRWGEVHMKTWMPLRASRRARADCGPKSRAVALYAAQFDASAYVDVEPCRKGLRDRPLFPAFPLLPRCKQKKRPGTHAAAGQDFTSMCSSQSTATDVLTQPTR